MKVCALIAAVLMLWMVWPTAYAEWAPLTGVDASDFDYFVDQATRRKTQDGFEIYVLETAKTPNAQWQSIKLELEANCATHQIRSLIETRYTGPMGTGQIHSSGDPGAWIPVISGSLMEATFKLLCENPVQ